MNIFKKRYVVLAALLSQFGFSQEGMSVYSDYLTDNYYLIHPSMAGGANCGQIRVTANQQWSGQDEAPALQTLSFNTSLGDQSGIGFIAFNDRNGYHSQAGGKLTYAHHIMFNRYTRGDYDINALSFGMSAGMVRTVLDETEFGGGYDPIINGGMEQKDSYFNVDVGVSYQYLDFNAHFTVKNAVTTKRDMYTDIESDNLRKYLLSTGYVFGTQSNTGWRYEPSVMFQFTEKTEEKAVDLNMKVYRDFDSGKLWGGVSFRQSFDGTEYIKGTDVKTQRQQYITPFIGLNYKKFMVAYTYSQLTGNVKFDKSGFHQITIGIDLLCKSDRY